MFFRSSDKKKMVSRRNVVVVNQSSLSSEVFIGWISIMSTRSKAKQDVGGWERVIFVYFHPKTTRLIAESSLFYKHKHD